MFIISGRATADFEKWKKAGQDVSTIDDYNGRVVKVLKHPPSEKIPPEWGKGEVDVDKETAQRIKKEMDEALRKAEKEALERRKKAEEEVARRQGGATTEVPRLPIEGASAETSTDTDLEIEKCRIRVGFSVRREYSEVKVVLNRVVDPDGKVYQGKDLAGRGGFQDREPDRKLDELANPNNPKRKGYESIIVYFDAVGCKMAKYYFKIIWQGKKEFRIWTPIYHDCESHKISAKQEYHSISLTMPSKWKYRDSDGVFCAGMQKPKPKKKRKPEDQIMKGIEDEEDKKEKEDEEEKEPTFSKHYTMGKSTQKTPSPKKPAPKKAPPTKPAPKGGG